MEVHNGNSGIELAAISRSRVRDVVAVLEQIRGERRLVGYEVELIASHTSDLNHVDPTCPECRHVRSVLLEIAGLMPGEGELQPRLRHVHNGLSLQLDRVLARLRQSLRGIREYLFVLESNRWAVP